MGHLVNPIAFRLGWQRSWIDSFYEESRFYPQLLHKMLRFRFFLHCFFRPRVRDPEPLFFNNYLVSHFRLLLSVQGIQLQIFYYNSRIDVAWYEFFDEISSDYAFGLKFFPKKPTESPAFASWNRRFLSLIGVLYHWFADNDLTTGQFNYRVPVFRAYENSVLAVEGEAQLINNIDPEIGWRDTDVALLRALDLIRFYAILGKHGSLRVSVIRPGPFALTNFEHVAHQFFRFFFMYIFTQPYLYTLGIWLNFIGPSFFGLHGPMVTHFFQVNNDQISARFLAKFLAIRLNQGFSVRPLISPIRRDLRFSQRQAFRTNYMERHVPKNFSNENPWSLVGQALAFGRLHFFFVLDESLTLWSFDHLLFAWSGIRQRGFSASLRLFQSQRIYFLFFLGTNTWSKRSMVFGLDIFTFFQEYGSLCFCNYEVSRHLYFRKPFDTLRQSRRIPMILVLGNALWDFLHFRVRGPVKRPSFPVEDRRSFRSFSPLASGLRGFRIRLHGRFSRKQIASAFHFQEGPMPLSTVGASIDYGFATIPLRNSAIGVKVWFYRQGTPPGSVFDLVVG